MSLLSIFDIAGSALSAWSQHMNVSASNMANADSVVGLRRTAPYRARQVVFQVNPAPGQPWGSGGVRGRRHPGSVALEAGL